MGEPETLSNFINWSMTYFHAKKYIIIFWDHGSGLSGFGEDIIFNNDVLNPVELEIAFLDAKTITGKN